MSGTDDVIDTLAGIAPGSPLDAIRAPAAAGPRSTRRRAIARCSRRRLRRGHRNRSASRWPPSSPACTARRRSRPFTPRGLAASGASAALRGAIDAADRGGQGAGPLRPLSRRAAEPRGHGRPDLSRRARKPGARWGRVSPRRSSTCTCWCSIRAMPRRPALQALLDAGWSTTDIVTLSQLVAFLSFQIRVVAGLRVLAEPPDTTRFACPIRSSNRRRTRFPPSSPGRSSTGCPGSSRWRSRR